MGWSARSWLCLVAVCAASLSVAISVAASAPAHGPHPGLWRAIGDELKGSFTVTANNREVTDFHGIVGSGAKRGCGIVRAGEALTIGTVPIVYNPLAKILQVSGKLFGQDQPFSVQVVVGGKHFAGHLAIGWTVPGMALVNITFDNAAGLGCHIAFFANG